MYDLERYLNVRSAYGASFAPDGELAFLHDASGVPQVWTVDAPRTWPARHTFYEERVTFATWSPERRELVFGMDEGGNERAQLSRRRGPAGTAGRARCRPRPCRRRARAARATTS